MCDTPGEKLPHGTVFICLQNAPPNYLPAHRIHSVFEQPCCCLEPSMKPLHRSHTNSLCAFVGTTLEIHVRARCPHHRKHLPLARTEHQRGSWGEYGPVGGAILLYQPSSQDEASRGLCAHLGRGKPHADGTMLPTHTMRVSDIVGATRQDQSSAVSTTDCTKPKTCLLWASW